MQLDLLIGIVVFGTGLLTLVDRLMGWARFMHNRELLKQQFGDEAGDAIHLILYTILPLAVGAYFLWRGYAAMNAGTT